MPKANLKWCALIGEFCEAVNIWEVYGDQLKGFSVHRFPHFQLLSNCPVDKEDMIWYGRRSMVGHAGQKGSNLMCDFVILCIQ